MSGWCWPIVCDAGPTSAQHWANASCLLGRATPKKEWVNIALRRFPHNHGNNATAGSPKSGLCPTFIERLQGFFIMHSTMDLNTLIIDRVEYNIIIYYIIDSINNLNSLDHCICAEPQCQTFEPAGIQTQYPWYEARVTTGSNESSRPATLKKEDVKLICLFQQH